MKAKNPNSTLWLNCWRCGVSGALKKLFSCFSVFGLFCCFCRLLWKDLGELVSMMERDPNCSMEIHYGLCESRLCEGIGEEISGERKDMEKKYIYEAG